ncbi:translocation/assembly module TamB domain-containing protein [Acidocella sp.]|uniref:translocation/assembly module TamB domain-containing protein n=1 Tax=Acidocella sp. TaxID=50710 RepID=UPI003CFC5294
MRWLKRILLGLIAVLLLAVLAVAGLVVALNSEAGRQFAVREINHFGKDYVRLGGLGGHFPADIKIPSFQLVDKQGTWLSGRQVELKWSPLALLRRDVSVQALTALSIDVTRAPAYPAGKSQNQEGGNGGLPAFRVNLDKLDIGTLRVAPALAGEAIALHVTGSSHLRDLDHGDIALDATTANGDADYLLAASLDPKTVSMKLHVQEPPDGLIGHFSGPQVQLPLTMNVTLKGPRAGAALKADLALGEAKLNLNGTLGLDQNNPFADVTLAVPSLAPFGTLAQQSLSGDTRLHLVVVQTAKKDGATLTLQGHVALTQAPAGLDKLLAGRTDLSLLASLQGKKVTIGQLALKGPQFSLGAEGTLDEKRLDLTTDAKLDSLAALAPQLTGAVRLDSHVTGSPQDFMADADITGQVSVPGAPSGPFKLALHATHLPQAPRGTLTGTGTLAGAPLALDAAFTRGKDGAASITVSQAQWKSLDARADLRLAAGAKLPSGTARLDLGSLADFDPFTGTRLHGAVQADFAYRANQNLQLNVTAKNVEAVPSLGAVNGTVSAEGKLETLAVRADATIARLMSYPAKLSLAGVLDVPAQSAHLTNLTANWRGLAAKLRGPADIETKPDMAVRHLDLELGQSAIALDGTLSPTLALKASVKNLDLSLAKLFVPGIDTAGSVNLTADVTGTPKAPNGTIALNATGLRYIDKSIKGLPAASLSGTATLKGNSADVNLTAKAGQDANITARGTAPLSMTGPMKLALAGRVNLPMLNPLLAKMHVKLNGVVTTDMQLAGTPKAPTGHVTLTARNLRDESGPAAALPPADIDAKAQLKGQSAGVDLAVKAGQNVNLTANGTAPLNMTGPMNLSLAGRLDLKLLDPILAANGNLVRGVVTTDLRVAGTPRAPRAKGTLTLADGSVQNIASGLNLTSINADIAAADKLITLRSLSATAGNGKITGHGTVDLGATGMPVDLALNADNATPIASDLVTETLNAALTLKGELNGASTLGGRIDLLKANINIPQSLPPSVANLPIHGASSPPAPPKSATPPAPPIKLALAVHAKNQIFVRGDGLFAELGGNLHIGGTTANPQPTGGFSLIRGNFSLAGKTLQFTSGQIAFNGGGFVPALDLEATTTTSNSGTATLVISGTASDPKIGLSSSPSLPSDEILAQLLFAQSSSSLSPFQAASLAAALAQISGVGGGFSPLDSVRGALGLDQLSVTSSGSDGPSVQAGRYVAPGVYVGATQSTTGQGTQAQVQVNLYKGLKLDTSTGTSNGSESSSVGLTYQFNY